MTKFSKSAIVKMGAACLAFGLILSSCSKEEAKVAPEVENAAEANLRVGPQISSTQMPLGLKSANNQGMYMESGWTLSGSFVAASNFQNMAGMASTPWENPLPVIFPGPLSFITLGVATNVDAVGLTKITGLIPGKKYKVTFNLSTSKPFQSKMAYVESCRVNVYGKNAGKLADKEITDLYIKRGTWINDNVTFTADQSEVNLMFSAIGYGGNASFNIHIADNALEKLN